MSLGVSCVVVSGLQTYIITNTNNKRHNEINYISGRISETTNPQQRHKEFYLGFGLCRLDVSVVSLTSLTSFTSMLLFVGGLWCRCVIICYYMLLYVCKRNKRHTTKTSI